MAEITYPVHEEKVPLVNVDLFNIPTDVSCKWPVVIDETLAPDLCREPQVRNYSYFVFFNFGILDWTEIKNWYVCE